MPEELPEIPEPAMPPRRRRRLYESTGSIPRISRPALPAPKPGFDKQRRYQEAQNIVLDYTMWSAGTGLVPIPFFDMVAMLAIEVRMIRRLSQVYHVPFSKERGKTLIAALLGGVHAGVWTSSCLKLVPMFGLAGVVVPMTAISGAMTYAIGRVFMQHFESGGTLLTFRPDTMYGYYREQFQQGRNLLRAKKHEKPD